MPKFDEPLMNVVWMARPIIIVHMGGWEGGEWHQKTQCEGSWPLKWNEMFWTVFWWKILGIAIHVEDNLMQTIYLNIVTDQVHFFLETIATFKNTFKLGLKWLHPHCLGTCLGHCLELNPPPLCAIQTGWLSECYLYAIFYNCGTMLKWLF